MDFHLESSPDRDEWSSSGVHCVIFTFAGPCTRLDRSLSNWSCELCWKTMLRLGVWCSGLRVSYLASCPQAPLVSGRSSFSTDFAHDLFLPQRYLHLRIPNLTSPFCTSEHSSHFMSHLRSSGIVPQMN